MDDALAGFRSGLFYRIDFLFSGWYCYLGTGCCGLKDFFGVKSGPGPWRADFIK